MLTSHLDNPKSPVRRYIDSVTPLVSDASGSSTDARTAKRLLGLDDLPTLVTPNDPAANPGTVGAGYDYIVRILVAPCDCRRFLANAGAAGLISLTGGRAEPLVRSFFNSLEAFLKRVAPSERELSGSELTLLARYCVVLALLESVFRTKMLHWQLPTRETAVPDNVPLLGVAKSADVEALVTLTTATSGRWLGWRRQAAAGVAYQPNPTFAGSRAVGGADADFVLAGELVEMKTQKELTAATARKALLQAVGYALLDWEDTNEIRSVGLFFARHDYRQTWPLWAVLSAPGGQHYAWVSNPPEPDAVTARLVELRQGLKEVTAELSSPAPSAGG